MNITVYDPTFPVDAFVPPGEDQRPEHVQAAIEAAANAGGGRVIFGNRPYAISDIVVPWDDRHAVLTIEGQGMGDYASPTNINIEPGHTGFICDHRTTNSEHYGTVHFKDFQLNGGKDGIVLADNHRLWQHMTWERLAIRNYTGTGIDLAAQQFSSVYRDMLIQPAWVVGSRGIAIRDHGNTSIYQNIQTYQCEDGGMVWDNRIDGTGGHCLIEACRFDGHRGPGILVLDSLAGPNSGHMAAQWNAVKMVKCYFEADGFDDGKANIHVKGHVSDCSFDSISNGPAQPAQRNRRDENGNLIGPIWLEVDGVIRRSAMTCITGEFGMRESGVIIQKKEHYAMTEFSFYDHINRKGRDIRLDRVTGRYQSIEVHDGQLVVVDVHDEIVGAPPT